MRSAAARDVVTARGRCRAGLSDFAGLAHDLEAAWNAPGTTAHARVASARFDLITDIIADVDEATREVVLTASSLGSRMNRTLSYRRVSACGAALLFPGKSVLQIVTSAAAGAGPSDSPAAWQSAHCNRP